MKSNESFASRLEKLPASTIKRFASRMGFSSTSGKSDLIEAMAKADDFDTRLVSLLVSLRPEARMYYLSALLACDGNEDTPPPPSEKIIDELTETGLAYSKRNKDDASPVSGIQVVPFDVFRDKPRIPPDVDSKVEINRFLLDVVRLMQFVRQRPPRVHLDGSPGVRFLSQLEKIVPFGSEYGSRKQQNYLTVLYWLSIEIGLIRLQGKEILIGANTERFFAHPLHRQIQEMFEAYLRAPGFCELSLSERVALRGKPSPGINDIPDTPRITSARRLIAENLAAVHRGEAWLSLTDFLRFTRMRTPDIIVKAVQEEEAGRTAMAYRGVFSETPSDMHDGMPRSGNWEKFEGEFISHALWVLAAIGIVELSEDGAFVRLTPEGLYCLGLSPEPRRGKPEAKCIVVQPNFEIVVYPEGASPERLHFLGSFADLVSDQESLAYRISQDSIYRAAEAGLGYDDIIQYLEYNTRNALPENVVASLKDWCARCSMVFFSLTCDVIEFDSGDTPDDLAASVRCLYKSSRYAVVEHDSFRPPRDSQVVDHRGRRRCASVSADGTITVDKRRADVFLVDALRVFCRAISDNADTFVGSLLPQNEARHSEQSGDLVNLLTQIAGDLPPTVLMKLASSGAKFPPLRFFNAIAVALPEEAKQFGLDTALLAPVAIGRIKDYWVLRSQDWDRIRRRLDDMKISVEAVDPHLAESSEGGSVMPPKTRIENSLITSKEEILRKIKDAVETRSELELKYRVPEGDKIMVVRPLQIHPTASDSLVEAYDLAARLQVLLTGSNIVSVRNFVRRQPR
ncbi:MAG: helicase-associated domain-containing protein [Candidatus Brocadiia bacterium]